jgi:hypothetical protein
MMINNFGAVGGIGIGRETENLPQYHLSATEFPITLSEIEPGSMQ